MAAAANVVEVVVKASNETQAGFDEAKASADEAGESMGTYAEAVDAATEAQARFDEAQQAQAEAAARVNELNESGVAGTDELTAANRALTESSLQAADARKALGDANAEVTTLTKAASDEQVEAGVKADESGGLMAGAGGKVKMAMLGIAVGMGLAVKSGMDFQQVTTKLVTSAGESASQLGMLQQGILKISAQTATSSTELANGLYMISSAGITGAGGLNVLKAAAEGAKSEGADLSEVTNALTSAINAYGMKTKTTAEATASSTSMMNQMLATVSAGKMTFQQLASSLSAVLPVAAANKISYAEVGASLATMTAMGTSAQEGTQQLANTIEHLANPTATMTNAMALFGISSNNVAKNLGSGKTGLIGTVQELSDAVTSKMGPAGLVIVNSMNQSKAAAADAQTMLKQLPASIQGIAASYLNGKSSYTDFNNALKGSGLQAREMATQFASVAGKARGFNELLSSGTPAALTYQAAMAKVMGTSSGLNVALALTGAHAATVKANLKSIGDEASGASGQVSGFNDVQKTTAFQMQKAGDSIKAAGTSLGLALLPAVNAILGPLSSMLAFIAGNKAAAIAFAVVIGGVLAGAIGAKLGGALKDMKDGIHAAGDGIEWLVGKLSSLGAASDAAAAGQEADAGAVAAANEEAAAESSGSWLASIGSQLAAGAAWVAESAAKVAMVVAGNVAGALTTAGAWMAANAVMLLGIGLVVALVAIAVVEIVKHWKSIVHGVEEAWDAVYDTASKAVSAVVSFVKRDWPLLLGILLGPIALAAALIYMHWRQIAGFFEAGAREVTGTVARLASDVVGLVRRLFVGWVSAQVRGVEDVVSLFESLGRRVVSIVLGLGSALFGAGGRIVQFLANGIRSAVGDVTGAISSVVDEVKSFLPFSPARKGPLSGSGAPDNSGRSVARLFEQGIRSGRPGVQAAMRQLTGGLAGGPAAGGGYGAAAGGRQQLEVLLTFQGTLLRAMQAEVRQNGGDPLMFTRKVAYR